jgi:hypothetical protein
MNRRPTRPAPLLALLAFVSLAFAGCESTPSAAMSPSLPVDMPSARVSQQLSTKAQVIALDKEQRLVTLRNEAGRLMRVQAGPEVRNLDQVTVGDVLKVQYQAGVTVRQLPVGAELRPAMGAAVAARAPKGEMPGAGVGVAASVRVRIESIDAPHDVIVFSPGSDDLIAHRIATPAGREFVAKLKVGDIVQLDYDEVLAFGIEKVGR